MHETGKPNSKHNWKSHREAFTMVEMLVVLFILLSLAAIALPIVRNLLDDQKITSAARGLAAYIDVARSRAIAEGRVTGILIERAVPPTISASPDPFFAAASLRVRLVTGVPPYSGEASNSVGVLQQDGDADYPVFMEFNPSDNQLLALSASMMDANMQAQPVRPGSGYVPNDDANAPIKRYDLIELPGGRLVPFQVMYRDITMLDSDLVYIRLAISEFSGGTAQFPSALMSSAIPLIGETRSVKFKIHRRPTISSTAPYSFPRGVAIDLNYSGMGPYGNEFAAEVTAMSPPSIGPAGNFGDIAILFGTDGKVVSVLGTNGSFITPTGLIFFCVGRTEGVRSDDLFVTDEKESSANLMQLDSSWLVINPSTGRVVASPMATTSTAIPNTRVHQDPNPDTGTFPMAADRIAEQTMIRALLSESRIFALLSDTEDVE